MSYHEAQEWAAYLEETGPLDLHTRLDRGFAMVAYMLDKLRGNKNSNFEDFLLHQPEIEATIEDAANEIAKALGKK